LGERCDGAKHENCETLLGGGVGVGFTVSQPVNPSINQSSFFSRYRSGFPNNYYYFEKC
jgi:hypothetical protein